jgi:hypothetical protein
MSIAQGSCRHRQRTTEKKTARTSNIPKHCCQKWSFWRITVNQTTVCNCYGQRPCCNCLSTKKTLIPSLHKPVPIIIVTGNLLNYRFFTSSFLKTIHSSRLLKYQDNNSQILIFFEELKPMVFYFPNS